MLPFATALILLLGCAWVVASLLQEQNETRSVKNISVTPDPALDKTELTQLAKAPLFGQPPVARPEPVVTRLIPTKNLDIKLLGTIIADKRSAAVLILGRKKQQEVFFLGSLICPGVTLKKVEADAILIQNQGELQRIVMATEGKALEIEHNANIAERPPRGAANKDSPVLTLSQTDMEQVLQDLPEQALPTQGTLEPILNHKGKPMGYYAKDIFHPELIDLLGLQNDDVIRRVNRIRLRKQTNVSDTFKDLKKASSLKIEIERNGKRLRLHYQFK